MVGLGVLDRRAGLQGKKTSQGTRELTVEGDFVAEQNFWRAGAIRRAAQG
jgi:hypothetical protein